MYSDDSQFTPYQAQSDSEQIPMLQRRTVHPDSLKFMDMAKDLLDSPEIQQAVEDEQNKQNNASST